MLRLLISLAYRLGIAPGRLVRFVVVGLTGVGVNMGLLYALTTFGHLFYLVAGAIAIETSIVSNFLLNRWWTWRDRTTAHLSGFARFQIVSIVGLAVNMALLALLSSGFRVHYLLSNMVGIGGATLWNYYANDRWTFAPTAAPEDPGRSPEAIARHRHGKLQHPPPAPGTSRGR